MAFPKLLQKLFQNNGAGDKLNKSIVPDLDYLPKSGGTVDGSVTINGTSATDESLSTTYKKGIKFGWGSEISQSIPSGLDIWAKRGDAETVLALYGEKKDGDTTGNTPGIYLRAGNGTATKGLRLTTSAATIDGVEIATLNTASRNLGGTSMVQLGFAKDSTVTLVQFLQKLAEKGYTASNSVLQIGYLYVEAAYVTDGTNTVRIVGGTLYLGQNTHNPSNDYGVAWGFFVPSEGTKLYRFRTYKDNSQAASDSPRQSIYPYESGGGLSVVAESYSANSWYRKYSDGWIEQGGIFYYSTSTRPSNNNRVTLAIPFSTAVYGYAIGGPASATGSYNTGGDSDSTYYATVSFAGVNKTQVLFSVSRQDHSANAALSIPVVAWGK